jgi:predicted  nucleic acid-binding Zn-ribbon protein
MKTELEGQLNSLNDKAKTLAHALEQMMKLVEQTLGTQEERLHKLEAQLKEKSEAVSKLESRIAGLEQTLKRPAKVETVREEPINQVTVEEEPEKQPMEVTVQTVASDAQPQTEEMEERQDKKRKRWM